MSQQDQPIEERIGSMIGKILVLALIAFLLWGYSTTLLDVCRTRRPSRLLRRVPRH